jgi:starch-binding outer membrane protein, SusD/RagB family
MKTNSLTEQTPARSGGRRTLVSFAMACVLVLTACDDLLTVDNPGQIMDRDLDTPEAVDPLVTGVAADFAVAYRWTTINMALYANEMIHTGSFPSWRVWEQGISARPSSEANGLYNTIARAVWVADNAVVRLENILEGAQSREEMAEVLLWGGFARFLFADNFCQATFDGGPPVSPQQIYADVEARLTQAMSVASAAGASDIGLAARAGRARARLMQGNHAGALEDAAAIPDGFAYNALYSNNSSREYNWYATYARDQHRREVGVHPRYYQDERYTNDPRTPFIDRGPGAVGPDEIRQWVEQDKFPSQESPIPITSGPEARLIEAEAHLEMGNLAGAVAIIDQLRGAAGLPAYDGPVEQSAVRDQLMYERSAELWLQGQRYLDLYRTNDPFIDTIRDTCVQIGQTEWETNPNLGG